MTITAGIAPLAGMAPVDVEHPSRMWARRRAWDLLPGWRFVSPEDGLVLVVAAHVSLAPLGRVRVLVWSPQQQPYADELDPWRDAVPVFIPAGRLLKTRTPEEEAAYLDAVDQWAAHAAIKREGMGK